MSEKSTNKQVWLVTGAGRGLGVDIAKSALAAGHAVVASGRNPRQIGEMLGTHDNLLTVKLDVTKPEDAQAAVQSTIENLDGWTCWSTTLEISTPNFLRS